MSRGVNKVTLIGNLGVDPKFQATQSGQSVASFTLATSEKWKDKETGKFEESTEWHNVVFYGYHADNIAEDCRKGSKLYIEGSIRTDKYLDKQGNKREKKKIRGSTWLNLSAQNTEKNDTQNTSTTQPNYAATLPNNDTQHYTSATPNNAATLPNNATQQGTSKRNTYAQAKTGAPSRRHTSRHTSDATLTQQIQISDQYKPQHQEHNTAKLIIDSDQSQHQITPQHYTDPPIDFDDDIPL